MDPKVSVLVLNYNGKRFLKECLSSVFDQSYRNFEVILIDNNSTDGSLEYAKKEFSQTKIISLNENYGFSKGNNIGILNSRGKYIAIINNDTKLHKKWLEELIRIIEKDEKMGIVCPKILKMQSLSENKSIIECCGRLFKWYGPILKGFNEIDHGQYNQIREVDCVSGAGALYRKEMFDEIGLFDEDFFMYYEDVDLCVRAKKKNWKIIYAPNAVMYHFHGGSAGRFSYFAVYYCIRNELLSTIKNGNWIQILSTFILFPFRGIRRLGNLLINDKISDKGFIISALSAFFDVMLMAPKMLVKRFKDKKF